MSIDGGLRPLFSQHLPLWHWQAIETGGTGRGIPDSNGCREGVEVWVEMKTTDGWKPRIRPEQVGWAERRLRAGGRVWLATRRRCSAGPRRESADELWLHRGWDIRAVLDGGLRQADPVHLFSGGPGQWDWERVERTLLHRLP